MTDQTALPSLPRSGFCALPHLGVIRAAGPDAASFLHNQLTQDLLLLKPAQARLAAFCNAKGRMQASMIIFKTGAEELLLVMRQDLLAQTLKRLSMFVLRAKVTLSDASNEWTVWGCLGGHASPAWTLRQDGDAWEVGLYPAAGVPRHCRVGPASSAPALPTLNPSDWALSEVLSGIADVQAATFEAFVPQMLNYESVDGVNFKKGCYPGQEVVARSQFRGTMKRRTYLVSGSQAMQAGQEVLVAEEVTGEALEGEAPAAVAGLVAHAASHPVHGHWALACLQTSAVAGPLVTAQGATLSVHPLPYPLREDI